MVFSDFSFKSFFHLPFSKLPLVQSEAYFLNHSFQPGCYPILSPSSWDLFLCTPRPVSISIPTKLTTSPLLAEVALQTRKHWNVHEHSVTANVHVQERERDFKIPFSGQKKKTPATSHQCLLSFLEASKDQLFHRSHRPLVPKGFWVMPSGRAMREL